MLVTDFWGTYNAVGPRFDLTDQVKKRTFTGAVRREATTTGRAIPRTFGPILGAKVRAAAGETIATARVGVGHFPGPSGCAFGQQPRKEADLPGRDSSEKQLRHWQR